MFKLLVVEDEQIERDGLISLIQRYFAGRLRVCGIADSGNQAVDRAVTLQPDIILLDIQIPEFDGLEAARIMRERGVDAEIVIATAWSRFEYARRALQLGAVDYLIKPYSIRTLEETLNRTIERIRQRSPEREDPDENAAAPPSSPVERAREYIEANYTRDLSLEEIACYCGLSRYHLSRVFREEFGLGIQETLIRLRVQHAQTLLAAGHTVAETAFASGFNDPNYFCRVFKKQTGCTAGQIQKRN